MSRLLWIAAGTAAVLVVAGGATAVAATGPHGAAAQAAAPPAARTAQAYNAITALTVTTPSDVDERRPAVDDAVAQLATGQAALTAAVAQSTSWRGTLGMGDGEVADAEAAAAGALTAVTAPEASGSGTFAELTAQAAALDAAAAAATATQEAAASAYDALSTTWTTALAGVATQAAAAAPHAPAESLAALTDSAAKVAADDDHFTSTGIAQVQALIDAAAKVKADEAAWQQAEAARIAAEEAARQAAAAAAATAASTSRSRSGGSSSGSSGSSGGSSGSSSGSSGGSSGSSGSSGVATQDVTGALLGLVNQARADAGLGGLSYDGTLVSDSCAQSAWMASTGNFAHSTSGARRAENIAYGYGSAQAVFTAWMNSSGHRANILGAGYTRMGACLADTYWTQQFR